MGRGNQYLQLVKALYCKLPTIGKQLPILPHKVLGLNCQPQKSERVYYHYTTMVPERQVINICEMFNLLTA